MSFLRWYWQPKRLAAFGRLSYWAGRIVGMDLAKHLPPDRKLITEGMAAELPYRPMKEMAATIAGELQREICAGHPLYGVKCTPIAYEARNCKKYLFSTDLPDAPFVRVHLTFRKESDPWCPSWVRYKDIAEFIADYQQ